MIKTVLFIVAIMFVAAVVWGVWDWAYKKWLNSPIAKVDDDVYTHKVLSHRELMDMIGPREAGAAIDMSMGRAEEPEGECFDCETIDEGEVYTSIAFVDTEGDVLLIVRWSEGQLDVEYAEGRLTESAEEFFKYLEQYINAKYNIVPRGKG